MFEKFDRYTTPNSGWRPFLSLKYSWIMAISASILPVGSKRPSRQQQFPTVIDRTKDYWYLGVVGYPVEPRLPLLHFAARALWCYGYLETFLAVEQLHNGVHQIIMLATVHRVPTNGPKEQALRKFEQGRLGQVFHIGHAQNATTGPPHKKIPIAGMWCHHHDVLLHGWVQTVFGLPTCKPVKKEEQWSKHRQANVRTAPAPLPLELDQFCNPSMFAAVLGFPLTVDVLHNRRRKH